MERRCTLALLLALVVASASSQTVVDEPASRSGPSDPNELEAFVDGVLGVMLDQDHSVGAVVSVVKDGRVFFAKGYGHADLETQSPVDPTTTLFRIGSVSKLFVWTSVMQLVEQGRLDLDADVNDYLDFEIPATYEQPITLNHIMAHAAGFEDRVVELFGNEPEDVRPLGTLLAEQIPARVRPPGDISSYSNHATGLAAYVVERVSGTDWIDYSERNIQQPLGMRFTTFRQPLPEHLAAHMSSGYSGQVGSFEQEAFEFVPLAPVGAAAASATDMARFMIAHLQLGLFEDQRILSERTARLMQSDHYRMDPAVNAMAHGFMVLSQNGQRIIGHGGNTFWFHTMLALFPEHDLGVFVSFNSAGGAAATMPFIDAFVDRYFPEVDGVPSAPEAFADRAARFTGYYRPNRYSHTSITKLGAESYRVSRRPNSLNQATSACS